MWVVPPDSNELRGTIKVEVVWGVPVKVYAYQAAKREWEMPQAAPGFVAAGCTQSLSVWRGTW